MIMWIPHQMSCGIHMIMVRAAAPPGQPGRNGHARRLRWKQAAPPRGKRAAPPGKTGGASGENGRRLGEKRARLGEKWRLGVPHTEPHLWDVSALGLVYPATGKYGVMPEPELTPGMYGPDITFAGVPRTTLDALADGNFDIVFIGAPFDGGTSHRPGTRFGPQAIRGTDYLPHDASRPHLALGVDPLQELRVADLGDVVMPSGEMERSLRGLESVVQAVAAAGAVPVILGGDHTITFPDATGVARHHGWGRVSLIHFDAHADTADTQWGSLHGHGTPMRRLISPVRCAATGSCRSGCAATGLSRPRWLGWQRSGCGRSR